MQSGIKASQELKTKFQEFITSTSQRALLVSIEKEWLVPGETISSSGSSFYSDLANITSHLKPKDALYVLLRRPDNLSSTSPPGSLIAVTYSHDEAPPMKKMLIASTQKSLKRELGSEHFGEDPFIHKAEELSEEGWRKLEAHNRLGRPLTREEEDLEKIKADEAMASTGTSVRQGHSASNVALKVGNGVEEALRELGGGGRDNLVLLNFDVPAETVVLLSSTSTSPSTLTSALPTDSACYTFYRHSTNDIVFIYTCPTSSKIKERMLYATSKGSVINFATAQAGIEVAKRLEATNPDEISETTIEELFGAQKVEVKTGFSKPKRPGRR